MGKKQSEATPNVNATANRDVVQRLNFLYQASVYLQSIAPPTSLEKPQPQGKATAIEKSEQDSKGMSRKQRKSKRRKVGIKKTTSDLGRSYVQCMRAVGQKSTVKMDPSLKRSLCSACNTTLVAGASVSVRAKPSRTHGHVIVYTCLHCNTAKRIPAPPNAIPEAPAVSSLASADLPGAKQESKNLDAPPAREKLRKAHGRRKVENITHPLPLFARRDAGHVVFRGNERILYDDEGGLGLAFI